MDGKPRFDGVPYGHFAQVPEFPEQNPQGNNDQPKVIESEKKSSKNKKQSKSKKAKLDKEKLKKANQQKEKVNQPVEEEKKEGKSKEPEPNWKAGLAGWLEAEANFQEERASHFRESSCIADNIVWDDPHYKDFNREEEQKFEQADFDEAENCDMLMTDQQIKSFNSIGR